MRALHLVRILALCSLVWTAFASDHLLLRPDKSDIDGKWEIDLKKFRAQRSPGLSIEIKEGSNNHWLYLNEERAPKIEKQKDGAPVRFVIAGDAGDLRFDGAMDGNVAAGKYHFEANRAYSEEAGKLLKRELTPGELLKLSFADVSLEFIRETLDAGVKAGFDEIVSLRNHGLTVKAIKEFAEVGFKIPADITRLRAHGVTTDYAKRARELGYGKEAEELVRLRTHGVTTDYLSEWKGAGFAASSEELIRLRNHGVQPSYGAAWKKAGFGFSFEELIRARNFGVPPEFAAALANDDTKPSLDEVVRLRQFGVSPDYYREMKTANAKYSTEEIVRFRQFGVQPDYVKAVHSGGARFSAEDIVKLRNNGVPADFIAALNVEGRKPLDASTIIDLRNRGISAQTARKLRE